MMNYNEILEWKDFSSPSKVEELVEKSNEAIRELLDQVETTIELANSFKGMVNEYQQNIIPLYKKIVENVEHERDTAVHDMSVLMAGRCCSICKKKDCADREKTTMCTSFEWVGVKHE